ncbi:hypothetical protein LINPERHAP1_LOCUS36699 [Linum perenne]
MASSLIFATRYCYYLLQLLLLWDSASIISAAGSASATANSTAAWPLDDALPDYIYSNGDENSQDDDIVVATEEMRRANYFTFVMLLNMMVNDDHDDHTATNVTFLMPNDRILSNITFTTHDEDSYSNTTSWSVREFMLRHSIPSPLLFDHLWYFPSGSTIPSSYPGYVLQVQNDDSGHQDGKWWRGRGNFSLNNVKIISPNICSSPSSSIRCHGIDGVLSPATVAPSPPPVYYCAPKPAAAPSDHDHDKLAPNPAPSSNHYAGAGSQPPSSHAPSSSSQHPAAAHAAAAAGGFCTRPVYQLLLSLVVLMWRRD